MDDEKKQLADARELVIYRMRLSCLYHQRREACFGRVDKVLSTLIVLSSTAAVASLVNELGAPGWLQAAASVLTTFLAIAQLVFNPAAKARHNGQKAAEFKRLQADAHRTGDVWTTEQCNEHLARTLDAEADEPAPLTALVADCENQLGVADGSPTVTLTGAERWLMHWVNFDPVKIKHRKPTPS
jgi:hypothetical protein